MELMETELRSGMINFGVARLGGKMIEGKMETSTNDTEESCSGHHSVSLRLASKPIQAVVQKFCGIHASASNCTRSGLNERDYLNCALQTYALEVEHAAKQAEEKEKAANPNSSNKKQKQKESLTFDFLECWEILKQCPKFKELGVQPGTRKTCTSSVDNSQSPEQGTPAASTPTNHSTTEIAEEVRPIGNKRAKRELAVNKFQQKVSTFMDVSQSGAGELRTYVKILIGALLVAIRDNPMSESELEFFREVQKTVFNASAEPVRASPNTVSPLVNPAVRSKNFSGGLSTPIEVDADDEEENLSGFQSPYSQDSLRGYNHDSQAGYYLDSRFDLPTKTVGNEPDTSLGM